MTQKVKKKTTHKLDSVIIKNFSTSKEFFKKVKKTTYRTGENIANITFRDKQRHILKCTVHLNTNEFKPGDVKLLTTGAGKDIERRCRSKERK